MESPSAPEQHSDDFIPLEPGRPPGLEFAMGVALFAFIMVAFFIVQSIALVKGVLARTPEFAGKSFSFGWFSDPLFQQRLRDLQYNGDLVGMESALSGGICALLILFTCWRWKREHMRTLLGLGLPKPMAFLKWFLVFAAIMLGFELLAQNIPAFETDFMEKVIGSTTNWPLLILGVVILGPLFEELLLRGLLFGSLRHIADEHISIAVSAGVFALMHLQYSLPVMLLILPMGVALGYARVRSGSIWVPVLIHMLNNGASVLWP